MNPIRLPTEPGLPRLELALIPAHPHITLGKDGKPKATGDTIPAIVRISTFPGPAATDSPARLRHLARQLLAAADTLERAHQGQYPLG